MIKVQHTQRQLLHRINTWFGELLLNTRRRQVEAAILTAIMGSTTLAMAGQGWLSQLNTWLAIASVTTFVLYQIKPHWEVSCTWLTWALVSGASVAAATQQGGIWSAAIGYIMLGSFGLLMALNLRAVLLSTLLGIASIGGLAIAEYWGLLTPTVVPKNDIIWPLACFITLLSAFLLLNLIAHDTQKTLTRQLNHDNLRLSETQAQLSHQQRVQEQFVASVSHELRTPMNAIMGFLQTIDRPDQLDEHERKMLNYASISAQQLLLRINELLDFSQLQANKLRIRPTPMDLRQDLAALLPAFEQAARDKGLRLLWEIAPDVPLWLMADRPRIAQVIRTLLGNAIKFTPHGQVTLRVTRLRDEGLTLSVQDTGLGIAESELERIFNRLSPITSRTRREMGGTGLGLSIAKALVELMGGTLAVRSTVGQGTHFTANLPCDAASAVECDTLHANTAAALKQAAARVLIVDDSPINLIVAQNLLHSELPQLDIHQANSGSQALNVLRHERFDLVLMDIIMPGLSGIDATVRIRAMLGEQAPPILGLSADTADEIYAHGLQAGMVDLIYKPFDAASLSRAVLRAIHPRH